LRRVLAHEVGAQLQRQQHVVEVVGHVRRHAPERLHHAVTLELAARVQQLLVVPRRGALLEIQAQHVGHRRREVAVLGGPRAHAAHVLVAHHPNRVALLEDRAVEQRVDVVRDEVGRQLAGARVLAGVLGHHHAARAQGLGVAGAAQQVDDLARGGGPGAAVEQHLAADARALLFVAPDAHAGHVQRLGAELQRIEEGAGEGLVIIHRAADQREARSLANAEWLIHRASLSICSMPARRDA
jgi:hypothetical protein